MARLMRIYRRSYLYIDADAMRARLYVCVCVCDSHSVTLSRCLYVCLFVCASNERGCVYMRLFRNGSIRYLLFCAFCLLYYVSLFTLFLALSFTVFYLLSRLHQLHHHHHRRRFCCCCCCCHYFFLFIFSSISFHSFRSNRYYHHINTKSKSRETKTPNNNNSNNNENSSSIISHIMKCVTIGSPTKKPLLVEVRQILFFLLSRKLLRSQNVLWAYMCVYYIYYIWSRVKYI